jgi:hypothetical protein
MNGSLWRRAVALRVALIVNGLVFALSAALNFGARIPLGSLSIAYPTAIVAAGIGEAIIAVLLLAAGISGRRSLAWLAFWLSVAGTLFGLVATSSGGGPVWAFHAVEVALALVLLALLLWNAGVEQPERARPRRIIGLMLFTALTLLAASTIHFGAALPFGAFGIIDRFESAAVPEGVLGILLAATALYLASGRTAGRELALASTIFTLLLSLFGLSVTLPSGRTGDVVYHIVLVVLLGTIIVGLTRSLTRARPHRMSVTSAPSHVSSH